MQHLPHTAKMRAFCERASLCFAILFSFHSSWAANASESKNTCEQAFEKEGASSRKNESIALRSEIDLRYRWSKTLIEFKKQTQSLSDQRKKETLALFQSVYFYDFNHLFQLLLSLADQKPVSLSSNPSQTSQEFLELKKLYDPTTWGAKISPFTNYLKFASEQAEKNQKQPVSIETLTEIHKSLMAGGVDKIAIIDLGSFRNIGLTANLSMTPLDEKQLSVVKQSEYLNSSQVVEMAPGIFGGVLSYLTSANVSEDLLKKISERNAGLAEEIRSNLKNPLPFLAKRFLDQKLVEYLVKERIDQFNHEIDGLELSQAQDLKRFVEYAANLQRDLIMIHPFKDGNGRVTRAFLNIILKNVGLPPVRLENPSEDYLVPEDEWRKKVYQGLSDSIQLLEEMNLRLEKKLSVWKTPLLFDIHTTLNSSIDLNLNDFLSYLIAVNSLENLTAQQKCPITKDKSWIYSLTVIQKDKNEFINFVKGLNAYQGFMQPNGFVLDDSVRNENKFTNLHLVAQDTLENVGRSSFREPDTYEFKMTDYDRSRSFKRRIQVAPNTLVTQGMLLKLFVSPAPALTLDAQTTFIGEVESENSSNSMFLLEKLRKNILNFNKHMISLITRKYPVPDEKISGIWQTSKAVEPLRFGDIRVSYYRSSKDFSKDQIAQFVDVKGHLVEDFYVLGGIEPDAITEIEYFNPKTKQILVLRRDERKPYEIKILIKEKLVEIIDLRTTSEQP